MPNLIRLKGRNVARRELIAATAITPGQLVSLASATTVRAHNVAAGETQRSFAVEREMTGDNIDVAYAIADTVIYEVFTPGDVVNALLNANAAAVVVGDRLESAGNGNLRKEAVAGGGSAVAIALETIDNSANASPVRIQVEVL